MRRPFYYIFALLLIFTFTSQACALDTGGPKPARTVRISNQAAESAIQIVMNAFLNTPAQALIAFTLNEEQVTSYLDRLLRADPNAIIQNPVVLLADGQAQVYGFYVQGLILARVRIVLGSKLSADYRPELELLSADFGPFPVPDGLREGVSTVLDEAFTGSFGPVATGFRLESVQIGSGLVTITGRKP